MSQSKRTIDGGLVIVFDGIDGVGKTSQLEMAKQALEAEGWDVFSTRNLGGTPIGEELRSIMLSKLERPSLTNLYISIAVHEALMELITEQRSSGKIVLLDRGPLALAAYEVYGNKDMDFDFAWTFVKRSMDELKPELTLVYDMKVDEALRRLSGKAEHADYFESMPPEYFERVANGYLEAAKKFENVEIISAGGIRQEVHENTMKLIQSVIELQN